MTLIRLALARKHAISSLMLCAVLVLALAGTVAAQGFVMTFVNAYPDHELLRTDPSEGDFFGVAAIDGDRAIVGAPYDDNAGGEEAGSAYIFSFDGADWTEEAILFGSDCTTESSFGIGVDIDGDTAVVGAHYHDNTNGVDAGSAYVFQRVADSWSQVQKLTASSGDDYDHFGQSVSIDGDTIVVGAPRDDNGAGTDAGAIYVFHRVGDSWIQEPPIVPSGVEDRHGCGTSVAVSGDTLVAGASEYLEFGPDGPGSAYVFKLTSGTWHQEQRLTASDGQEGDSFGTSVAIDDDLVVVGAPWEDHGIFSSNGAAYIYERSSGEWVERQKLSSTGGEGDWFGYTVGISGGTVVVEGPAYMAMSAGKSFTREDDTWTEHRWIWPGDFPEYRRDGTETWIAISDNRVVRAVGMADRATGHAWVWHLDLDYGALPVSGTDRFDTSVQMSAKAFPDGSDWVIVATARNWPDALGGSALAGAYDAPILLVDTDSVPSGVANEITRLGADNALILGGEGAVGPAVFTRMEQLVGAGNVTRIWGADRYATARAVAQRTIARMGDGWDGTAFLSTGANFPDALAGSPIAAQFGWPVYLADPGGGSIVSQMEADGVDSVLILGGEAVVSTAYQGQLEAAFGVSDVQRLAGSNRYATAAAVAGYGVDTLGMHYDGLALSTGENFPDALAGGVLCARRGSVMLLTPSAKLDPTVASVLSANEERIGSVYYLGGTGAVSQTVRDAVAALLD